MPLYLEGGSEGGSEREKEINRNKRKGDERVEGPEGDMKRSGKYERIERRREGRHHSPILAVVLTATIPPNPKELDNKAVASIPIRFSALPIERGVLSRSVQ